jgi:ferredoxin
MLFAYSFQSCSISTRTLYNESDFSLYVGAVVTLVEYPDECWTVGDLVVVEAPETFVTILGVCQSCEECVPPAPTKFIRTEPKPVLEYFQTTVTEQNIFDTVRFANNYYSIFLREQHGITGPQENIDVDKFYIKKQLIDLENSKVLDSCEITTDPVPVVCVEPGQ